MEIVGSNDGINFIRIPTQWSVTGVSPGADTLEDVFHVKYNRRSKGGSYAWVFADNFATVSTVTASTNISSPWYMLTVPSSRPMICTINVVNATAYRYYGLGAVGSGVPYYTSDRVTTFTTYARYYARHPYSHSYFCDHKQTGFTPSNWQTTSAVLPTEMMLSVMPWITNQGYVNYMIPQVLPSTVVSTPIITYKYWRFRATSGFLGAFGNTTSAYFWKLGLFRDITTANEDTFGTYSTNYIQQWGNSLYNNSGTETTKGNFGRDALFCSKPDWSDSAYTRYTKSSVVESQMPFVTFTNDSAYMTIKLDVTGTIGALRFPSYMYSNVRGGSFILEVSNTGATGSWTTMVATCGTAILGREGTMPIVAGTYGGNAILTNRIFSITPAINSYSWPTSLDIPIITGATGATLKINTTTTCTIRIIGGNTITNTKDDFNVHLVPSDTVSPYWTPGTTIFNCTVTSYNPQTSILSFNVNPSFPGDAFFVVFTRSGEGTGLLGTTTNPNAGILTTKPFYITPELPRIWLDGSDPKYTALTSNTPTTNENIQKWFDKSGGTSHCAPQNAGTAVFYYKPSGISGINKGCMYMPGSAVTNGTSPLALIPYPGGLSYMSTKYTFSILCKATVNGSNIAAAFISSIDTQHDGSLLGSFFMGIYNNTLQNYTHTVNNWGASHVTNASNNPININNTWVHLVLAFDESTNPATSKMYMNGVMLNSTNHGWGNYWNAEMDGGTPHIAIGAGRDGQYGANMYIADIQMYDFALNEPAVKFLSKNLATKFGVTLTPP